MFFFWSPQMALQEINDLRRAGPYRQFLAIGQHEILYLARQLPFTRGMFATLVCQESGEWKRCVHSKTFLHDNIGSGLHDSTSYLSYLMRWYLEHWWGMNWPVKGVTLFVYYCYIPEANIFLFPNWMVWNTSFLLGPGLFSGANSYCSFREGILL